MVRQVLLCIIQYRTYLMKIDVSKLKNLDTYSKRKIVKLKHALLLRKWSIFAPSCRPIRVTIPRKLAVYFTNRNGQNHSNRLSFMYTYYVVISFFSTGMSTEIMPSFKGAEFAEVLAIFLLHYDMIDITF